MKCKKKYKYIDTQHENVLYTWLKFVNAIITPKKSKGRCNLNLMYIMQPKPSSTLYICISYLYNINKDKWLLYQLPNMISKDNLLKIRIIKETF